MEPPQLPPAVPVANGASWEKQPIGEAPIAVPLPKLIPEAFGEDGSDMMLKPPLKDFSTYEWPTDFARVSFLK